MRVSLKLLASVLWLAPSFVHAQHSADCVAGDRAVQNLSSALEGQWTGVLEYRDYSEPATSTKRTKLLTWLTISRAAGNLRFRYVYDDGPSKTVVESQIVAIGAAPASWTTMQEDRDDAKKPVAEPQKASISGLSSLKDGRGTLVLVGSGTDNGQPSEIRTTVRLGRNLLEILRETRRPGEDFQFRHSYTLIRAQPHSLESQPAS